jgi:hypothetical protein
MIFGPPNIGTHHDFSRKTTHDASTQDNGISFIADPSQTRDQERRENLEALQKARAEKIAHTLEPFIEEDADEDDDQAIDRELERVQQKVQQLQNEKKRFEN